jgi:hypothetical protein
LRAFVRALRPELLLVISRASTGVLSLKSCVAGVLGKATATVVVVVASTVHRLYHKPSRFLSPVVEEDGGGVVVMNWWSGGTVKGFTAQQVM